MITAVLLAAGASRRFGDAKLTQDLQGAPIIRWSANALRDARLAELMVVVAPRHDDISRALEGLGARLVVNHEADRGLGRSIARAVDAAQPDTRALLMALADEPFLSRDVVAAVLDRYETSQARIIAPRFAGVIGHPVLFDRAVFPELQRLDGDRGARGVVERDATRVAYVDLPEPLPLDVDTPDDLALARARAQNTSPSKTT